MENVRRYDWTDKKICLNRNKTNIVYLTRYMCIQLDLKESWIDMVILDYIYLLFTKSFVYRWIFFFY